MDLGLGGARAFVLAASKGLGRASAASLVDEGARVAISSSSESNLAEAERAILDETGADQDAVSTVVCDLTDADAVGPATGEAIDALGGLDVLVTNSPPPPERPFDEASLHDFDAVYTSVLRSRLAAADAAIDALADGGGALTNVIATSAREPTAHHILANTIRPGVYGFAKALSAEYGDAGVRVNCVTPRGIWTDRAESRAARLGDPRELDPDEIDAERRRLLLDPDDHALGRFADPAEFGRVVAFVSSPAAGYVTGSVVDVDGGWSAGVF